MKTIRFSKILTILLLISVSTAVLLISKTDSFAAAGRAPAGTDYFVSPDGDNSDGTTWAKAKTGFGEIEWDKISPGDTIYIDGGTSGITYSETLEIDASGSSDALRITVKTGAAHPSLSAGHTGLVTISGEPGNNSGILFNGHDFVTVDGNDGAGNRNIKITETGTDGVKANGCTGVKILYLWVYDVGDDDGDDGIDITESDGGTEVAYCLVEFPYQDNLKAGKVGATEYGLQSIHDNILRDSNDDFMTSDGGVDIFNNTLGPWADIAYGAEGGHPDGIQLYEGYTRIYGNVFKGEDLAYDATNALIYANNAFNRSTYHHILIFNNLFYLSGESYTEGRFWGVYLSDRPSNDFGNTETVHDVWILNNTFVDIGSNAIFVSTSQQEPMKNIFVDNNLIYNCKQGTGPSVSFGNYLDYDNSTFYFRNNVVAAGEVSAGRVYWNGETYTALELNSETETGLTAEGNNDTIPHFVAYTAGGGDNNNLHLAGDDYAALDLGRDLSSLQYFQTDKDGITRPQGSTWDIGAYEFVPGLALHGTPANQAIHLTWELNSPQSPTSWTLHYDGPQGDQPPTTTGIPAPTRAYTLTGLTNNVPYTITLTAIGTSPLLSDTVQVTPIEIDNQCYLPLIWR